MIGSREFASTAITTSQLSYQKGQSMVVRFKNPEQTHELFELLEIKGHQQFYGEEL